VDVDIGVDDVVVEVDVVIADVELGATDTIVLAGRSVDATTLDKPDVAGCAVEPPPPLQPADASAANTAAITREERHQ